ncbi:uncharacterized protein APUU_70493S [Aspergillus puulaauensis]|uniref:Uncharacterized protein n=1 Tax=Aspergillus puulaauensis TaxID=1220207 RepID=A0A7R7XXZ9_9EURO|nr:uncharacterized protein APUU_70493S [Aspergillus puulaauensis]BCS28923.1 hypothetical protein APUU_70493S [Aspergillus puulaauensis]
MLTTRYNCMALHNIYGELVAQYEPSKEKPGSSDPRKCRLQKRKRKQKPRTAPKTKMIRSLYVSTTLEREIFILSRVAKIKGWNVVEIETVHLNICEVVPFLLRAFRPHFRRKRSFGAPGS